ncbi:hypothetical protein NE237_032104 [Protea cynaroides]|uniref:Uncharacterized protein n=1 Tax=Protea cynaroides TaxID=273540 RepID=A0A9Q0R350_9MAGN|nr:hypothetical protein NE237_032104 [Protea cynaroides]
MRSILASDVAKQFGLKLKTNLSRIKPVDTEARPVAGIVEGVSIRLGLASMMKVEGIKHNPFIFVSVLTALAAHSMVEGIRVHGEELPFTIQEHCVLKNRFEFDNNIRMTLIAAYAKCDEMDGASTMDALQNVVLWTAIISGYLQNVDRSSC